MRGVEADIFAERCAPCNPSSYECWCWRARADLPFPSSSSPPLCTSAAAGVSALGLCVVGVELVARLFRPAAKAALVEFDWLEWWSAAA